MTPPLMTLALALTLLLSTAGRILADPTGGPAGRAPIEVGVLQDLAVLDPARTRAGVPPTLARLLHEPLVRLRGAAVDPAGSLLAGHTVRGGQEWVLEMKEGLRFSDGTDLDAAAVVMNLERLLRSPGPGGTGLLPPHLANLLVNMVPVGATRIRVNLSRPYELLLHVLASPHAGIASPLTIQSGFRNVIAGTGPYRLVRRSADHLDLEANPHFVRGTWALAPLRIRSAPAPRSRLAWILSGYGDIVEGLSGRDLEAAGRLGGRARIRIETAPGLDGIALLLDTSRPPFDTPWMRDALFQALGDSSLSRLYSGRVLPRRAALPASGWVQSPPAAFPASDPKKAAGIIEQSETAGRPAAFTLALCLGPALDGDDRDVFATELRHDLHEAGFLVFTEWPATAAELQEREVGPQAVLVHLPHRIDEPGHLLAELFDPASWTARYLEPVAARPRELLEKVRGTGDPTAQKFLYESLGEELAASRVFAYVACPLRIIGHSARVAGVALAADGALILEGSRVE